jgi:hypothetical protein
VTCFVCCSNQMLACLHRTQVACLQRTQAPQKMSSMVECRHCGNEFSRGSAVMQHERACAPRFNPDPIPDPDPNPSGDTDHDTFVLWCAENRAKVRLLQIQSKHSINRRCVNNICFADVETV